MKESQPKDTGSSTVSTESDVDHPQHYTQGDIECIQAIEAQAGPLGAFEYCRGAVSKYLWRCLYKGNPVKDLKKARWYIERAIANYERYLSE